MNVIFLDIDGVLNTAHFIKKNYININIDESKVMLLANICKKYDCKIVISSSWKLSWNDNELSENLKYLFSLFNRYGIECIGKTPNIRKYFNSTLYNEMWKEYDIMVYLLSHPEIEHFCIIDDEDYDLQKLKEYLIKTIYYSENEFEEGLTEKNVEEIGKILGVENKYKKTN